MQSTGNKSVVSVHVAAGVALVRIRNPPVNALSQEVRRSLLQSIAQALANKRARAIVLTGDGIFFSAGADISEFGQLTAVSPSLPEVVAAIEACPKPVIAVINGVALGGGLEVALACHYRICVEGSRLGLPEVNLGVIPGAGGTQRLPRIVPLQDALTMVTAGRPITSQRAREIGLVDAVCSGNSPQRVMAQVNDVVVKWLSSCSPRELEKRRTRNRALDLADDPGKRNGIAEAVLSKLPSVSQGGQAARVAVDVILAAYRMPFDTAVKYEEVAFVHSMNSHQSRGIRHVFFAERDATRIPRSPDTAAGGKITKVGVVGAGTMGAGIATSFLLAGFDVVLSDISQATLQRAQEYIRRAVESAVRKGRLSEHKAHQTLAQSLRTATELSAHSDRELVVECVFESMSLKKQVFKQLSSIVPASTILCSNTSTLDIDEIASASNDLTRVMGMHFFSPADVMKLVECVRGKHTDAPAIGAVMRTTKQLKKTPVLVGNCFGFVGNRMIFSYSCEAMFLLEEGATAAQVDTAVTTLGFKMGPFQMSDMAGNDVGFNIRKELGLTDPATRDPALRYSTLADQLYELKRFGLKTGRGWYRYAPDSREPIPDEEVDALVQAHRRKLGIAPRQLSDDEIRERLLMPLINEGFKILEGGIASRPGDIDVIFAYGYGWPPFLGGPMYYAQHHMGLSRLLKRLREFHERYPGSPYFEPSNLLQYLVANRHQVDETNPKLIEAANRVRHSRL